ncbi:MAG TPA: NAD-dependent epimerase/dehydratase family protein [Pyrinomonadaceae bacterium]|nr:NAD-dependent epimerase/dehydratase family protein [Pyrinomonadaceae bacterium]
MKIFIAGATGVLGRGLVRQFTGRGHSVLGLARGLEGERAVRTLGGESRQADIFDADSLAHAAEGAEVVIHAATSIPSKTRTGPTDWEMNDRLRRAGTRALAACASKIGAKLYLQQSIVWLARPRDGSFFDEEAKPQPDAVTQSALDGEEIAFEAGERSGFKTAVLRCGYFYGPDSSHTRMFGKGLVKRRIPIVGRGDAVLANLHTEDAASAFVAAAEAGRSGLWHVVDDEGITVKDFLSGFAERLGAPEPRHVPVWLARLIAGSYAASFFTTSTRTSNARFRQAVGWSPAFPSYREGLDQIVRSWKSEGFNP